jgi:hypothetical protein
MGSLALFGSVGRVDGDSVKVIKPDILKKHWQDALTASKFYKEIGEPNIEKQKAKDGTIHYLFIAPFKDGSGVMAGVLLRTGDMFNFVTPENAVVCSGDCPISCLDIVSKGSSSASIVTSGCPGCIKTEVIIH